MRYLDEFRDKRLALKIISGIKDIAPQEDINIMEVCGTHTQSFRRFGLNKLLPANIRLIAGPGCPVCVSSQGYIDAAIKIARRKDTIIATFGDMLRLPGAKSSLEKEKVSGSSIRLVYSPLESLDIARKNPDKKVIFLAVGFQTTAPAIALSIISAKKKRLKNLFFFPSLKLIIPAMEYLLKDRRLNIKGFLCPGHVSAIIGPRPYEFIPKRYSIPCCVAGFEALDILEAIFIILKQIKEDKPEVANQYLRVVTTDGNIKAKKIILKVFKKTDAHWRGFGIIPKSGLKIKDEFLEFDAEKHFSFSRTPKTEYRKPKCRCGDVLKGLISPEDCPLFARGCSPDNPIGPCMVSSEGTCNAYYQYR